MLFRSGVALSKLGYMGEVALSIAAIIGALSVMALIVYVSQKVKGNVTLLIIGVMIGYVASAIIGVLKYFSVEEDIRAYVIWGLGSFARVSGGSDDTVCLYHGGLVATLVSADKDDELVAAGRWVCTEPGAEHQAGTPVGDLLFRCTGGNCDGILRSDYVYRSGCSPSLPGYIPYIRSSDTDACHIAGRGFVGVGVQPHSPHAGI